MLKRFKVIKRNLQDWSLVIDGTCIGMMMWDTQFVEEKVLDDLWWDKINYIIAFTELIYDMIRVTDTDKPSLHLVYDMWDTTIEKVKSVIYRHEEKRETEQSLFYDVVYQILEDRWNNSNTHFNV